MVTTSTFASIALSFPASVELPHFNKRSFRVNKKIFATLDEAKNLGMVKLSLVDQSVFCAIQKDMIYPVPGGWGRTGSTFIDLVKAPLGIVKDALGAAYRYIAPKNMGN